MIFTTWWDSPAKRCQILFFKMFVKKVFRLVKPFLANLHYSISKKYSYMYSMTPKFFDFFFNIWVSKKRRILRWFQIRGNNLKKVYLEKVIRQKLLQVSSREEYKLQFCTLLLPVTFLLANFLHFSQQFRNQRKILSFLDTHIQVLWRKSFYVILALFWNFKALFARNGSKFWKTCFTKVS